MSDTAAVVLARELSHTAKTLTAQVAALTAQRDALLAVGVEILEMFERYRLEDGTHPQSVLGRLRTATALCATKEPTNG